MWKSWCFTMEEIRAETRAFVRRMYRNLNSALILISRQKGAPAPPGKPVLIPGPDDSQSDVVLIRWNISPHSGGSSIIGYYVEQRKMGSPHWESAAPVICREPELMLSGLEPGWRYQFRIRAQNFLGTSEPSELSDPLTVTLQNTTQIVPKFNQELRDSFVVLYGYVEIMASYSGLPIPVIRWFKNDSELMSSGRIEIKTDCNKSVLIIKGARQMDEGEIKCIATNRAGRVTTKAKLIVEVPAFVRLPKGYDEGLLFAQDEEVKLRVTHGGKPSPSVTWYHNGEIVLADHRRSFESTAEGESILIISNAVRDDRGEYTVRVINKHGEGAISFLVTIIDSPSPPRNVTVTRIFGRSVSLAWMEPDDDGGSSIGNYLVEYHRMGWDMWLKSMTCKYTTVMINDLIEGSEYEFRVKAENLYGLSDPSEKTQIVFIPDVKRGITEPNMRIRSVSHRDIPRGRSERREISFHEPTQRTRSLTREEASNREAMSMYERTLSPTRLVRSSRADSRVTFILDANSREKDEPPTKEREVLERSRSPQTTIVVTPNYNDSGGQRTYLDSRSRTVSYSREHSPSPLVLEESMEVAIKQTVDSMRSSLSPPSVVPRHRRGSNETETNLKEGNEDDMLHGSSEFMLVLYPGEEDRRQYESERLEKQSEITRRETRGTSEALTNRFVERQSAVEVPPDEEEEDLIPPPMSLSLPELFSPDHQIVEIVREAVSSTELLHERAMERFYRAVEAEQSIEQKRNKTNDPKANRSGDNEAYPLFKSRSRPIRRRLSNSGANTWQVRRDRRRSSEGEANVTLLKPPKLPVPSPLLNVLSDPNLLTKDEKPTQKAEPWLMGGGSSERLRRWHEPGIDLNEESTAASIDRENTQNNQKEKLLSMPELKPKEPLEVQVVEEEYDEVAPDIIYAEDSIETSYLSSEAESTDSEDLKHLKDRIMAIPVLEEEETYHPRGRMLLHLNTDTPPPVPPHRSLSPSPTSPNGTIVPKSILKKRTETESIPVNQFGRPIPPEKPIRKSLPPHEDASVTMLNRSISNQNFEDVAEMKTVTPGFVAVSPLPSSFQPIVVTLSTPTPIVTPAPVPSLKSPVSTSTTESSAINKGMTDSDKEAVISAGEAAVSKRKQMRQGSKTHSTEESEEEHEEKMAVVSHYTELVKQYSNPDFRQRSLSRDREIKRYESPSQTRVASPMPNQTNQYNSQTLKKEALSVTPGKTIEPISPIGPPITTHNVIPTKIITPIPPVIPSMPIKQAMPILQSERSGRRGSLSSRANESDSDVSVRGKLREPRPVSDGDRERQRYMDMSDSRSSTPSHRRADSRTRNENRPPARNESPMPRSRNVSRDRGSVVESRSSSNARESRPVSGAKTKSSRPSSRASSRDRSRANTPAEMEIERLQRALDEQTDRLRRLSSKNEPVNAENINLRIETEKKIRTTLSFLIDMGLLMAAFYLYLFKREELAIPIIVLLLYRHIQQEIKGWIPRWWRSEKR
ncbi:uncharacterized protein LOC106637047 isoform X2 [Copidosoma floridanum]|uniref:uncharacterized protein LOC106637047 isoform X2 n=1 Tax=Copidosoma floridanum TaxID=29053 RepID=UPI000C6F7D6A|nr:uncharacterized protein LOC106637047 isoform X2 [Copidosoma floridanum]